MCHGKIKPWKNNLGFMNMSVDINDEVFIVDEVDEYLMGSLESLALHEGEMLEGTKETSKSCIDKNNNWFVYACNEYV